MLQNCLINTIWEEKFYSYTHSKIPCIIIEPIKTDKESPNDLIGSPIQSHEQRITQINVNSRMSKDFFEKMCLIIVVKFDMFVS